MNTRHPKPDSVLSATQGLSPRFAAQVKPPAPGVPPAKPPLRLREQLREAFRLRHYSTRTEEVYVDWVRRLIVFNGKRHPRTLGAPEVAPCSRGLRWTARWRRRRRSGPSRR